MMFLVRAVPTRRAGETWASTMYVVPGPGSSRHRRCSLKADPSCCGAQLYEVVGHEADFAPVALKEVAGKLTVALLLMGAHCPRSDRFYARGIRKASTAGRRDRNGPVLDTMG